LYYNKRSLFSVGWLYLMGAIPVIIGELEVINYPLILVASLVKVMDGYCHLVVLNKVVV